MTMLRESARSARSSGRPANGGGSDPRIRARKVAVAREAGKKRLRLLGGFAALAAVVALLLGVLHSSLFAARKVAISGMTHTTRAEIMAVSGLGRRPPLIDVNSAMDEAAIDRLPWVASSSVARHWPDGIKVAIVERHAVAELADGGAGYALVDLSGRVLEKVATRVGGLALVTGAGDVPAPGAFLPRSRRAVVEAAGAVPVSLLSRVASLTSTATSGVVVQIAHGPQALLGASTDLREKMVALATVIERVPLTGIVTIDLRVPTAPVLTP